MTNLDPKNYTGRSERQVEEFIRDVVDPMLATGEAADEVELIV